MKTLTSSPSTFPFMYHTGLPSISQTKQAALNFKVSADVPSIWNTLIPGLHLSTFFFQASTQM